MSLKVIKLQAAAANMQAIGCYALAEIYNKLAAQAMRAGL
jgi:hypothetical protein